MAILELDREGAVAIIKMNNGANKQDLGFAQTLNSLLEEVQQDETMHALVLASTDEKNWSQGIFVEWMIEQKDINGGQDVITFFQQLDEVYSKLMLMPMPTIAAINGHAFGAGAFLATACDYRFMNGQRGFFCFPEIDLKMDFQPGVFKMLVHKLPDFKFQDLLFTGKHAAATELEKTFIVEKACDGVEDTLNSAMAFAAGFNKDRKLIASYKQKLNGDMAKEMIAMDLEYHKTLL